MESFPSESMTRRNLFGLASVGAGALILAGCGGQGPEDPQSAPASAPTGPRKRGGKFRLGSVGFTGATSADPMSLTTQNSITYAMYEPLMVRDHQYRLHHGLAEEFEPHGEDQTVWTIRVRDDVTFHNGKSLTADDVIYSLRRAVDPKSPTAAANLLEAIDPNAIKKLDKRTLRLKLKYPNSQLSGVCWRAGTCIVPAGFDPHRPVGTGPFKQKMFTPRERWVGTRNDNYWREGQPYLDEFEILGFSTVDAQKNALISGQVDAVDDLPPKLLPQIKGRAGLRPIISDTGSFQIFAMRCDKGAMFEDNRVRQAFKLIVDRQRMIELAWSGYGDLGNDTGVWHRFDPAMDSSLSQHRQDIDKAKSLLKAAGKDGMEVTLRTAELSAGQVDSAKLLMQDAKKAGVKINLNVVPNSEYYGSRAYQTSQLKVDSNTTTTLDQLVAFCFTGDGAFNNTGYNNRKVASLFKEALSSPQDRYLDLMHEVSKIIWDQGPWVVWGRSKAIGVSSAKFTGLVPDVSGNFNGNHWNEISLA